MKLPVTHGRIVSLSSVDVEAGVPAPDRAVLWIDAAIGEVRPDGKSDDAGDLFRFRVATLDMVRREVARGGVFAEPSCLVIDEFSWDAVAAAIEAVLQETDLAFEALPASHQQKGWPAYALLLHQRAPWEFEYVERAHRERLARSRYRRQLVARNVRRHTPTAAKSALPAPVMIDGKLLVYKITCREAPLQIEGWFGEEQFYFRARWNTWEFSLSRAGSTDAAEGFHRTGSLPGPRFPASYLAEADGLELITDCLREYCFPRGRQT